MTRRGPLLTPKPLAMLRVDRHRGVGVELTLAPAVELDGDGLVHVFPEVEDVLLLGPLAVGARTAAGVVVAASPLSSTSTATATAAAVASASATPVVRGSVGHDSGRSRNLIRIG